jgi:hypothetical protein
MYADFYDYKKNDQWYVRTLFYKKHLTFLNLELFDKNDFPNGLLYFDEDIIGKKEGLLKEAKNEFDSKPNKEHYFVHANFMVGNQKKIDALKKRNLWFV